MFMSCLSWNIFFYLACLMQENPRSMSNLSSTKKHFLLVLFLLQFLCYFQLFLVVVYFCCGLDFCLSGLFLFIILDFQFIWIHFQQVIHSRMSISWFQRSFELIVYVGDLFSCGVIPWIAEQFGTTHNVIRPFANPPLWSTLHICS